jgi:hypothetical protein
MWSWDYSRITSIVSLDVWSGSVRDICLLRFTQRTKLARHADRNPPRLLCQDAHPLPLAESSKIAHLSEVEEVVVEVGGFKQVVKFGQIVSHLRKVLHRLLI